MIGIDTNILLRYILADDASQLGPARHLIDEVCSPQQPAHLSDVDEAAVIVAITAFEAGPAGFND